jgi:hypothetical protein
MKKITLLLAIIVLTFSCKNTEQKTEETVIEPVVTEITTTKKVFQGEFIVVDNAAVFKGTDFIYGVTLNDVAKELASQVENVKNDAFDMVPVIVKGTISKKPEGQEGWDEILTINEIVKVSDTPSEADIKIDAKKK